MDLSWEITLMESDPKIYLIAIRTGPVKKAIRKHMILTVKNLVEKPPQPSNIASITSIASISSVAISDHQYLI